jgi:hypothetical protein
MTVAAAVRHFGLSPTATPQISDTTLRLIVIRDIHEKLPIRAVAERTGVARDKIPEVLRAAGIPLRGRGARIP